MEQGVEVALTASQQVVTDEVKKTAEADAEGTFRLQAHAVKHLLFIVVLPISPFQLFNGLLKAATLVCGFE